MINQTIPRSDTDAVDANRKLTRDYYDYLRRIESRLSALALKDASFIQTVINGGGGDSRVEVVSYSGTAKTLIAENDYTATECTSATAVSLTIAPDSSGDWADDAEVYAIQGNTGQVTFVAGAGVTLDITDTAKTRTQESTIGAKRVAANRWQIFGDTEPVAPALSVLVRADNSSGPPDFLESANDGEVLTRSSGALVWAQPAGEPPLDTTLTYNMDGTLDVVTTSAGTKTMGYTGDKLTSITGTGTYQSKTFSYTGDQLTSIDVL